MQFVQPRISEEEARKLLGKRGGFPFRRKGEIRKVELVYLPYYLHRAVVAQGAEEHDVLVCTDGISGFFSFFDSTHVAFCERACGEVLDFVVSAEEALRASADGLRWHLLHQGLRLKVRASVRGIREVARIHYPYWVAYFKRSDAYGFRVADAVTGEIRDARIRAAFLKGLSRAGGTPGASPGDTDFPQKSRGEEGASPQGLFLSSVRSQQMEGR